MEGCTGALDRGFPPIQQIITPIIQSLEDQRNELGQIATPYPEAVLALGLDPGVANAFCLEPFTELLIRRQEAVLLAATNPKQPQAVVGFWVQLRKLGVVARIANPRAEGADPREAIKAVKSDGQRFTAAHRKTGNCTVPAVG